MTSLLTQKKSGGILHKGAENTLCRAVVIPTESGIFSRPGFLGFGRVLLSERTEAWLYTCFQHPSPSYTLEKVKDGYQSRKGDRAMSTSKCARTAQACFGYIPTLKKHLFTVNPDIPTDALLQELSTLLTTARELAQSDSACVSYAITTLIDICSGLCESIEGGAACLHFGST